MPTPADPNFAAIYDKLGELDAQMGNVEKELVDVKERLEPLANIEQLLERIAKDQSAATDALLKIPKFVPEIGEVQARLARLEAAVFPQKH